MPLRNEIKKIPKNRARTKVGLPVEAKLVTILGGSQGANSLNTWALNNLDRLNRAGVSVCCVCGPKNFTKFKKFGTRGNFQNLFLPFCDNMAELLCSTDLLVCRAGAGTIAEAMRLGIPMILVPYPYAAENHQEFNSNYARKLGCAAVVRESEINKLTDKVLEIFKSDFLGFAKRRSYRNSNKAIVDVIKKLIGIKNA
jgi:UDP-N-acetylglucosamine--N-acetylmuramyl-(pentapeptide) pyrophosphoryl-undecaprenol N-acetylglucosamine transferase